MQVEMAKVAGFCMGVRRAMNMALNLSATTNKQIYTYGPLIHNPSALELLRSRGVDVLENIPKHGSGTVIIRAHGITPLERTQLKEAGFEIVDATCPKVVKVQMLARHYAAKNIDVLLIGDKGHPEVKGIMGYANKKGQLITNEDDILSLPKLENYIILAQTTQDPNRYRLWTQKILTTSPNGKVFRTICDSTYRRQAEVKRLAEKVDVVIVVGGKQSANTKRLAELVYEMGRSVLLKETADEIEPSELSPYHSVGVTAGASTPQWVIDEVVKRLQNIQCPR